MSSFEEWKSEVSDIVYEETGYTCDQLPDQSYFDWYDEGSSPEDAADFFIDDWKRNGDIPK